MFLIVQYFRILLAMEYIPVPVNAGDLATLLRSPSATFTFYFIYAPQSSALSISFLERSKQYTVRVNEAYSNVIIIS